MSEALEKLRPDRDLQSYFFRPSAVAALSGASPAGFTLSGSWRQQGDWAVIEWTRDNVFEHPTLRPLPDGDLSGLTLSYRERRTNCIPLDSGLYPTVDWPYLRLWVEGAGGAEQFHQVRLADYATPTDGAYAAASAVFELQGTLSAGDVVELSWLDEHYYHTITSGDTKGAVLGDLAASINGLSGTLSASYSAVDGTITLTNLMPGAAGNRLGIVGTVSGSQTEQWVPSDQLMSGGQSPSEWRIDLDFSNLVDIASAAVPTQNVRKMRWTYAADLQAGAFQRSEFLVEVSAWTVTGAGRGLSAAGLGSRRIEDDGDVVYTGTWAPAAGNSSGGSIRKTNQVGATASVAYTSQHAHELYLGTRKTFEAGIVSVTVDQQPAGQLDLYVPGEDQLIRLPLGALPAGSHEVSVALAGANPASGGNSLWFDFVEAAVPVGSVFEAPVDAVTTLATDWDTDHSVALPPERVAWNLHMLGFHGRANHYVGALLFYELVNPGNVHAEGTVVFQGNPVFSQTIQVVVGGTVFSRLTLSTDTGASVAKNFEYLINNGSTGVWAHSSGNVLTIVSRLFGSAGNSTTLSASPTTGPFKALASGPSLAGGVDGEWLTDVAATPRLNRATRDWHMAYFAALASYGISATAAFSMELGHGDSSAGAGIAQRYPDGAAVLLNTPALQTNFSPTSTDFWKEVYRDMAQLQADAGVPVSLQFGEVQWWYFPNASGMTFYDTYTTQAFAAQYGRAMHVFLNNTDSPAAYPEEAGFLPGLIGTFTQAVRSFVKASHPAAKFEVLYPPDVNDYALTQVVNFASSDWTPSNLDGLKTENFSYTAACDMNKALTSIQLPFAKGFSRQKSAHLIGVVSATEPWEVEYRLARREGLESVVLWAFDQFCLIGYPLPLSTGARRGVFVG